MKKANSSLNCNKIVLIYFDVNYCWINTLYTIEMTALLKTKTLPYSRKLRLTGIVFILFVFAALKSPQISADELDPPPAKVIRTCCAFGSDLRLAGLPFYKKNDIISVDELGRHEFLGGKDEGNGIIYTYRGGFIDLGHLRDYADWTYYLHKVIISNRYNTEPIQIALGVEGGEKSLTIMLPEDFDECFAVSLAGKIAYDLSLWHEIATWFGASYIPLIPERYSSFSPEDLYSNLLGIKLGSAAIQSGLEFEEAMTRILLQYMDSLQAVDSIKDTYEMMNKVENLWWSNTKPLPSKQVLLKRYFDRDAFLLPWLVETEERVIEPHKLYKPDPALLNHYTISIRLNAKIPAESIFPGKMDRLITQHDFAVLLDYVEAMDHLIPENLSNPKRPS